MTQKFWERTELDGLASIYLYIEEASELTWRWPWSFIDGLRSLQ